MSYIIPICEATLDLIEVLNDGVRPQPELDEEPETFYIYKGKDEHADIITRDQLEAMPQRWIPVIKIMYVNE
jgi:hypothetical protein